ncbi:MAG: hypothetical protein FWE40_06330 [Oscillospiraceae bacterium]|nr:hypothetical protein [Oscillospiraceae bacterium]
MQLIISLIAMLFQLIPWTTQPTHDLGVQLARETTYIAATLPCGHATVFMAVDFGDPRFIQLYSPAVLRAFSREAEQLQREFLPYGEPYWIMCARHIAGETKLHLWGYTFTTVLGGECGPLASYHLRLRVADLNVDEDRIPPWLMRGVGWAIVG